MEGDGGRNIGRDIKVFNKLRPLQAMPPQRQRSTYMKESK